MGQFIADIVASGGLQKRSSADMYVLQISLTHAAAKKIRATAYSIWRMAQANQKCPLNRTSVV